MLKVVFKNEKGKVKHMKLPEVNNMVNIALGFKVVDRVFLVDVNEAIASRLYQLNLPLLLKVLSLNSHQ